MGCLIAKPANALVTQPSKELRALNDDQPSEELRILIDAQLPTALRTLIAHYTIDSTYFKDAIRQKNYEDLALLHSNAITPTHFASASYNEHEDNYELCDAFIQEDRKRAELIVACLCNCALVHLNFPKPSLRSWHFMFWVCGHPRVNMQFMHKKNLNAEVRAKVKKS